MILSSYMSHSALKGIGLCIEFVFLSSRTKLQCPRLYIFATRATELMTYVSACALSLCADDDVGLCILHCDSYRVQQRSDSMLRSKVKMMEITIRMR
jgi:hypothetical protein